jgi:threonyl-tRNA synthetase
MDGSNEKLGAKIRDAQLEKIPYMLIVGEKEASSGSVSLRKRSGEQGSMSLDQFVAEARRAIDTRALTL